MSMRSPRILCMAFIFCAVVVGARSQTAITITGLNSLNFGSLSRSALSEVDYFSGAAAQFRVTGDTARAVRLTVSFSGLLTSNGASSEESDRTMALSLGNTQCAYSLDNGESWNPFTTGTLYQDTEFPPGFDPTSSIIVRVGGNLTTGTRQQRGVYTGNVTLTADYR